MKKTDIVMLLKWSAYNVWCASFSGSSPRLSELFSELNNPKVGDLAMETTTFRKLRREGDGIGRIVKIEKTDSIMTQICHIECIFSHGRILKWENCSFIKIKEDTVK